MRRLCFLLLLLGLSTSAAWAQGQKINGSRTITGTFNAGTATGSSNAYLLALSPAITAYTSNQCFTFKANFTNTAAATLNVNSVGAKTLKKYVSTVVTDLAANDITSGQIVKVCYDGTNMQLVGTGTSSGGGSVSAFIQAMTATNSMANYGGL
jgi:ribosomal protein L18